MPYRGSMGVVVNATGAELKVYNEIVRSVREFYEHPPVAHRIVWGWRDLPEDRLRGIAQIRAKQVRPWTVGFPRWLGNIYGNCPEVEVRRILLEDMGDEDFKDPIGGDGHIGLQRRMALALGLENDDLENGPFLPEVLAVYHSMEGISKTRPWLEALACVMGTETLTVGRIPKLYPDMEEFDGKRGGGGSGSLEIYKRLGLSKDDLAFVWAHDITRLAQWEGKPLEGNPKGTEAKHQAYIIKTLTEHARTPEERVRVVEMVRLGHALYRLRFDGIGRAMQEYLETGFSPWGPNAWKR